MDQMHATYMQRCLQLALLGKQSVAPNPMVGAVLVHEGRIIGEGYHKNFGGPHAEVNCIASVKPKDQSLIAEATLYISLEPCAHHGKTPPCTDLILKHKIPQVVVGCTDTNPAVKGRGIAQLQNAGVKVISPVIEDACRRLNERFFTFHEKQRPWFVLKWAASANGKIGKEGDRVSISNAVTNRLVHRWRSEEAAIMVATNTALYDDPQLTNRYWGSKQPLRVLLDMHLRLPSDLKMFQDKGKVVIFNGIKEDASGHLHYCKIDAQQPILPQIGEKLHALQIQSVLVEGGARLLSSFMDAGFWDEARVITNTSLIISEGLDAPQLNQAIVEQCFQLDTDTIQIIRPV